MHPGAQTDIADCGGPQTRTAWANVKATRPSEPKQASQNAPARFVYQITLFAMTLSGSEKKKCYPVTRYPMSEKSRPWKTCGSRTSGMKMIAATPRARAASRSDL